jgi:hypothetical protein
VGVPVERASLREERFVVKSQLGAGGMGVVYRVFDRVHQRDLALKTLKTQGARDLYRFKREFRALCDLAHPNLCRLHELHTTGDEWFFTMELVRGVGFIDWVRPGPGAAAAPFDDELDATLPRPLGPRSRGDILAAPLDLARLEAALYQLCDGVHALHLAGKLHRDLKPSNVLVEPSGRVVLLDFGLIADVELAGVDHTHERAAVGTPAYMSPEQAADVPLDAASDWYSVGAMLYEALTGRRPFEGRPDEIMRRKQLELPPPPRALVPDLPPALDALCLRLLATDPRDRPDGAAVLAALGRAPSEATRTVERTAGASAPFVGRTAQLDALAQALLDSRQAGVAVMVRGVSGMGKSALVARFLDTVGDAVLVLAGRCYEREAVPFKTLDTLVDALTGALLRLPPAQLAAVLPDDITALARLFPVLRRVPAIAEPATRRFQPADPQELRRRGFAALRVLLERLAAARPVIVAVDDLQWGDLDSVGFLVDLITRPDRPNLLLVLVHRSEDTAGPIVASIEKRVAATSMVPDVRVIEVPPLAIDEATDLVATLAGTPGDGDAWAEALVRDAGGNTLFLSELARSATTAGGATTLDELLRERIARLPPSARALLRACAVAARPMPAEVVGAAAGVDDVGGALAVLRAERLVRGQADRDQVEPYHDRIRAAVVDELATGELQAAHRELADAYQHAVPGDREPLVDHLLGAGEPQAAAEHAVKAAATAAEALAFRRAADLYAIALQFGSYEPDVRCALLIGRASALVNAGHLLEAAAMYAEAVPLASPDERTELERLRIEQLLRAGRLREGMTLAAAQMRSIGCELPDSQRATIVSVLTQRLALRVRGTRFKPRNLVELPVRAMQEVDLLWSVCSGLSFANPVQGKLVQLWHLRRALALGERRRVAMALALEVGYLTSSGIAAQPRAEKMGARALEVAIEAGDEFVIGLVEACTGLSDFLIGQWTRADQRMKAGLRRMRDHGVGGRWELDLTELFYLSNLFYCGQLRELARLAPIYLREAEDRGDVYAQNGIRAWRPNVAWLVMGKPEDARAHSLAVAMEHSGDDEAFQLNDYNHLLANTRIDLYIGDGDGALARVERAWRELESSLLLRVTTVHVESYFLLGTAALASTRADRAAVVRRAIAGLTKAKLPWADGLRALLIAGLALIEGQRDRAALELVAAEDKLRAAEMPLHLQVARQCRGELLGGAAGATLREDADAWLRGQTVADPRAFARIILPRP